MNCERGDGRKAEFGLAKGVDRLVIEQLQIVPWGFLGIFDTSNWRAHCILSPIYVGIHRQVVISQKRALIWTSRTRIVNGNDSNEIKPLR